MKDKVAYSRLFHKESMLIAFFTKDGLSNGYSLINMSLISPVYPLLEALNSLLLMCGSIFPSEAPVLVTDFGGFATI
jgi:hypothetical protein